MIYIKPMLKYKQYSFDIKITYYFDRFLTFVFDIIKDKRYKVV